MRPPTTCAGSLCTTCTWKSPMSLSPRTFASASASAAGALRRLSPGFSYSSLATMSARRRPATTYSSECLVRNISTRRSCSSLDAPDSSRTSPAISSRTVRGASCPRPSQPSTADTTPARPCVPSIATTSWPTAPTSKPLDPAGVGRSQRPVGHRRRRAGAAHPGAVGSGCRGGRHQPRPPTGRHERPLHPRPTSRCPSRPGLRPSSCYDDREGVTGA